MADTTFVAQTTRIVATWLQKVNDRIFKGRDATYAASTGTANAYVLTLPSVSLYSSLVDGDAFTFKANFANTGAATLQIVGASSLSAKNILLAGESLAAGRIQIGDIVKVQYDGTQFQIIGGNPYQRFIQSGIGAVATTAQAQLRKFIFRDNYSTSGNYDTARAALTGRMAAPSLEVEGSSAHDEALIIRAHSGNGEWIFRRGQAGNGAGPAAHRMIINETAASPQVAGIRYQRNGSDLWDLDIDTNGDFFIDDVTVAPSQAALICETGQSGTGVHIKATKVLVQRGLVLSDVNDGTERVQLLGSTASGLRIFDQTQAGPPEVMQITLGGTGSIIFTPGGGGTPRMTLNSGGAVLVGTTADGTVSVGDVVLKSAVGIRARNNADTATYPLIRSNSSDDVVLGDDSSTHNVRWSHDLVALGGGSAPTLGTIGGNGPATAGQNSWMRVLDPSGVAFWVPAWK